MSAACRYQRLFLRESVLVFILLPAALVVTGCADTESAPSPPSQAPVFKEGTHRAGPWQYEYSVANKGTRSEGYYGRLFYREQELATPGHVNDYYKTPWGPIYWVGKPPLMFGNHGWMASPLAREPVGQALADPATLADKTFAVRLKLLTADELGTPDGREHDRTVLDALKAFGLQQAHVQKDWFPAGHEWVTLHNTKRWGSLELRLADPDPNGTLAIMVRSTGDLSVDTTGRENPFESLLAPPMTPGTPKILPLPPQGATLQVFKCTLSGIAFDPLELFLVCQIEERKTN